MKTLIATLAATLVLSAAAFAQPNQTSAPHPIRPADTTTAQAEVTIQTAAWLAGRWVGEGLGGEFEESWSPPASGQMVGHFRLMRNGAVVFYEIALIDVTEAGGLRMRVKHFNTDFVGWEEKADSHAFEPVSATAEALSFSGLTIRPVGRDAMETVISIRYAEGVRDEMIRMRRAPL